MNVSKKTRRRPRKYTVFPADVVQNVNTLARCIEDVVDEICVIVKKKCGIEPYSVRKENHVFLNWPDDEGGDEIVTDIELYLE